MTRLILPTVFETDELFTNGFVIVQERRWATPRRARIWKQHEEKAQRAHPMRQVSSTHLWCNDDDDKCNVKGRKRRSRKVVVSTSKSSNDKKKNVITLTKNHVMETTQHTKCKTDGIPRPPLRTLPSLYFS
jgi:hypothetical protein